MPFDQSTRNRLNRFVGDARTLLTAEFTRQLQNDYGMDPATGDVVALARLTALDDAQRETALILRTTLGHYVMGGQAGDDELRTKAAAWCMREPDVEVDGKQTAKLRSLLAAPLDRIVREQAFTILNRLCAIRMAEARGFVIESVGQGYRSRGFPLYQQVAGAALGETGDAYRYYLFSLFDELAVELPVLFDRFSPMGRLFPRPSALLELLELTNHVDLRDLWAEDETLGWIYQYFNSQEERRQMRAESQAPRNSRELAVRNQFFTPRYVVEFLTDNTLGRIWFEMAAGRTQLVEGSGQKAEGSGEPSAAPPTANRQRPTAVCRYLVRRPVEVFLAADEIAPIDETADDDLSQEELLRRPVFIPHRPLKDPRTLLMLDPACGSMHFGLYSFDLYEVIYGEAWDLEESLGADALQRPETMLPLHETYPDKAAFLRDVPRLIIEHNIHGIDIDLRAVQIAGLSLWLRAQRSWQRQGVKLAERPTIRKSNVVCAEPMPGDWAQLEAFLKTLRDERLESLIRRVLHVPEHQRVRATPTMADALCDLVSVVWDEMKLAGEAGSLLKIEESLTTAIQAARDEWEQQPLFRIETFRMTEAGEREAKPKVNYTRDVPGEAADFWTWAETLVLAALAQYAEQADGDSYARRLFAADAARGFAFIDVCRKRYDVALMNPPFGAFTAQWKLFARSGYPVSYNDIMTCFVQRGTEILKPGGRLGAITSRTCFFLGSFAKWRTEFVIEECSPSVLADLGFGVMDDAFVESAAYVLEPTTHGKAHMQELVCFRLVDQDDRAGVLLDNIDAIRESGMGNLTFSLQPREFLKVPAAPFAYWVSNRIRNTFSNMPPFEGEGRTVRQGLTTANDGRFLRVSWEVAPGRRAKKWFAFAKGGDYSPFYSDLHLLVNWENDGSEVKAYILQRYPYLNGKAEFVAKNPEFYFRSGLTWPRSTVKGFNIRALSANSIFGDKGPALFVNDESSLMALLGLMSSSVFELLLYLQHGSRAWEVGIVQNAPFPDMSTETAESLAANAREAWRLKQLLDSSTLTSSVFDTPECLKAVGENLNQRVESASKRRSHIAEQLTVAKREIDELALAVYGLDLPDIGYGSGAHIEDGIDLSEQTEQDELFDEPTMAFEDNGISLIENLVDYLVGCVMGRWSLGAGEPKYGGSVFDPFAPLHVCPPGMLQNSAGLPATPADVPADYPLRISWPGILVDDPGHPEDVVGRVREALAVIWPENHDAIEQEACQILGVASLRDYFGNANRFFDDHLKRYSKSRRQAPIYWPLSTASGSYTLWIYYHRLTDQMLYTCVVDFVDPKLKEVSEDVARLRQSTSRSRDDERELARLSDLELELKEFRAELLRLAPIWKPNLNDGVQITAAPLWKLFQHRAWQRTLRETWEKLEAGDYDWAHLAMSFWPARVVPKCTTDRSLAIAHDVEDLFWVEEDGRWRPLATPDKEIAGQRARQEKRLSAKQRERLLSALRELAEGPARGVAASQVAQHLAEGEWDDTELALLCWPERVAEKCLDDAEAGQHAASQSARQAHQERGQTLDSRVGRCRLPRRSGCRAGHAGVRRRL
jgi:hypothetical protein